MRNLAEKGEAIAGDAVVCESAAALLRAQAWHRLMCERVEPIHAELLRVWKPTVSQRWDRRGDAGRPITDWKHLYLADDEVCRDIFADMQQRYREAGLIVSTPGNSPELEAGELVRLAERALAEAACVHFPSLSVEKLCGHWSKEYRALAITPFCRLLTGFLLSHPKSAARFEKLEPVGGVR